MPLFSYECKKCEHIIEKFQHKPTVEALCCAECNGSDFQKIFGIPENRTHRNAKDYYNEVISPEAKRIRNKIDKGSDKDFIDIYGEK